MHLFWHQRDLRLPDNRGLARAAADDTVLPVYVVDPDVLTQIGTRQRAFFLDGVRDLRDQYRTLGSDLVVRSGAPAETLANLVDATGADRVYYNTHYRPARRNRQRRVDDAVPTESATDLVLVDPARLEPDYPNHGRFYDDWEEESKLPPVEAPDADDLATVDNAAISAVGDDGTIPEVDADIDLPEAGYRAARERYDRFLDTGIGTYNDTRDDMRLAVERPIGAVSRLSPYLAAGMIGIREVWADATEQYDAASGDARHNIEKYRYELSWREQNYHLLYHNPTLLVENYTDLPNPIAWENDEDNFEAWKHGETGYPLIDAGMRQLNAEGYIHNRPRQNVASFLTKHLLIDWRNGARYFTQQLVDHDPASNHGNWQWIASTGTDSVDVRIFDPVAQLSKYDDGAHYVKTYVPELRDVPAGTVVEWPTLSDAERDRLAPAYPHPIVDRDAAYERAQRVFGRALGKR